jgi:hypothetical protein
MEISEILTTLLLQLAFRALPIIFWIAIIIFSVTMRRRGGGRAEMLLIIGAGINLAGTILSAVMVVLVPCISFDNRSVDFINTIFTSVRIALNIINMVGIICIIYAFWVKFNSRKAAPTA